MRDDVPIILLDMDGVQANFVKASIEAARLPVHEDEIDEWSYYNKWCSVDEFWKRIGTFENFWLDLEKYEWSDDLFRMCSTTARTVIATSPSPCKNCPGQKVEWLRKHGYLESRLTDYMLGPHKELMARPNTILIDDSDRNVELFIAAGGKAITFPQRWNKARSLIGSRLEYVGTILNQMVGQIVTG